jgi:glycosyltransferase A (GT-A) superfamily protein (DUF2064 family)
MKDLKTAILIFAHSAEHEAKVKPFLYSKEVFQSLNQRTLQIAKETKLPYFLVTEKEQFGTTFGERFTNAMQSVYDLGYQSLIVIGNDTPHLATSQLNFANTKLAENGIVLGSSQDGGFYLLGIKKEHFKAETFLKLPWQNSNLSTAITNIFAAKTVNVFFLKKLQDIDNYQDIKKLVNLFKKVYQFLFQLLLHISFQINSYFINFWEILPTLLLSNSHNKGSPVFI